MLGKFYSPYRGGIETVTQNMSEGWVKNGHQVTVVCFDHKKKTAATTVEEKEGVKVIRVKPLFTLFSQPFSLHLIWVLFKLQFRHDFLIVHSPNPLGVLFASIMVWKIPLVNYFHSDIIRQKLLKKFYLPIFHFFLWRCKSIVAPTQYHIDYSPSLVKFKKKCTVIPFGITDQHNQKSEILQKKVEKIKADHGEFALFVGRLVPYKGARYLVQAAAKAGVKVIMVGKGPLREELHQMVTELNAEDRVIILNDINSDLDLSAYYQACKFFVLPSISRAEMFGMVLIEAMSCAKPVITTNLKSGVRWVNRPGVVGLEVEPKDVKQLEEAMKTLYFHHELCQEYGQNARERFEKEFLQERMIERLNFHFSHFSEPGKKKSA